MKNEYKEKIASKIAARYADLEVRIMQDIVRRIKKTGEITSTADWQINRLRILGYSSEDIEKEIKKTLNASYPEMFELYDKVIDWEYVRNKDIYEQINAKFIPYEENKQLQQINEAIKQQSLEELENITGSLGFYLDYGGRKVLTPLSQVYSGYLDNACMDIVTGVFDYNSVLRKVVTQLTNSGLRKIDYASGYASRVEVAARRAVMTGLTQISGKLAEYNAEKLGTEYFEVEWHAGARPTHAVWQGRVWTKEQLYSVCGLGTVTGLCGANCYHTYYPFFPGISVRNWSDEWLEKQSRKENKTTTFGGKEYTLYEAKQRQRQMETAMRAQREKVQLLQQNGADPQEVMLQKAKYQGQLNEYSQFCGKMGLTEERERIYLDMHGRVAPEKNMKMFTRKTEDAIIKSGRMYRKKSSDSIEPMPKKQLQKIVKAFKRNGGIMQMNDATDAYLRSKKAEAITYDAKTILLKQRPGRAAVFEELIHATQYRQGKNDGSYKQRLLCEIEAQEKLIKYQKAYKLTPAEVKQTEQALKSYRKELEDLLKGVRK